MAPPRRPLTADSDPQATADGETTGLESKLPIGWACVWTLNAGRIAALIILGGRHGALAVDGFHSIAGWLGVNLVSFFVVIVGHRAWFATPAPPVGVSPAETRRARDLACAHLLPFLAWVAVALLGRLAGDGTFDPWYPARVVAVGLREGDRHLGRG